MSFVERPDVPAIHARLACGIIAPISHVRFDTRTGRGRQREHNESENDGSTGPQDGASPVPTTDTHLTRKSDPHMKYVTRTGSKIVAFDKRHLEATRRRFPGHASTHTAATNHQDVELL